jgi:hypothetical protein
MACAGSASTCIYLSVSISNGVCNIGEDSKVWRNSSRPALSTDAGDAVVTEGLVGFTDVTRCWNCHWLGACSGLIKQKETEPCAKASQHQDSTSRLRKRIQAAVLHAVASAVHCTNMQSEQLTAEMNQE